MLSVIQVISGLDCYPKLTPDFLAINGDHRNKTGSGVLQGLLIRLKSSSVYAQQASTIMVQVVASKNHVLPYEMKSASFVSLGCRAELELPSA